jgi:hypothetical protein
VDAEPKDPQRNQELRPMEGEMRRREQLEASLLGTQHLPLDIEGGSRRTHQPSDLR